MKKLLLTMIFGLFIFPSWGQIGALFPEIEGNTLTGKSMSVPSATKGKVTLIGMAYSKKSDDLLKAWFEPVYLTFINPPKGGFIPVEEYNTNTYFIPMLRGIAKAASNKIKRKMKEGIDPKLHPQTLVYEGAIADYKKTLGLGEKDLPYFFVLDADGKILYKTSGAYSERKLEEIVGVVEKYQ